LDVSDAAAGSGDKAASDLQKTHAGDFLGKGSKQMAKITLFKLSKPQGEEYTGVDMSDVTIEDGLLTFICQPNTAASKATRIKTTLPFFIEQEIENWR
jgi:hypothetical protein